jgi:hypothetical protein
MSLSSLYRSGLLSVHLPLSPRKGAHLGNLQAARHYFVRHAGIRPVTSMTVNDVERLEHFAIMSGLAPQSVDAIRPDLPRWVRYMKKNGMTEIPDSPLAGHSHAVNMASLLIRQKAGFKGGSIAHELRNLTGIRPWKL